MKIWSNNFSSFRDVVFDMMVDERQGEVAAALSRLARRYFSYKYFNICLLAGISHANILIFVCSQVFLTQIFQHFLWNIFVGVFSSKYLNLDISIQIQSMKADKSLPFPCSSKQWLPNVRKACEWCIPVVMHTYSYVRGNDAT